MTLPLNNTQEGGTLGALVTPGSTGNSGGASGSFFNAVSNNVTYTDQHVGAGTLGLKAVQDPTTAGQAKVTWSTAQVGVIASGTLMYFRKYLWWPALPTSAQSVIIARSTTAPGQAFNIRFTTTGAIQIQDQAGTAIYTSTQLIPAGVLVRLEGQALIHATAGHILTKAFYDDGTGKSEQGTTEAFSLGSATANQLLRGNVDAFDFGLNTTATGHTLYFSELEVNTTGWPGPAGSVTSPDWWRRNGSGGWARGGQIKYRSGGGVWS